MDWLKRLVNEPGTLIAIFSSGLVGFVIGMANGVIQRKHGGWSGFFSAICTGVSVSIIVGLGLQEYIKSEAFRLAIIGICAVIADDIWTGLKAFGSSLRTDPLGAIARLLDALRGRSTLSTPPPPSVPPRHTSRSGTACEDEASYRGPAR